MATSWRGRKEEKREDAMEIARAKGLRKQRDDLLMRKSSLTTEIRNLESGERYLKQAAERWVRCVHNNMGIG